MNREKKETRVRFAPSPTGHLHIGSARIALFNYLYAKKNKGEMILRIEDTDKERSKKEYEEYIMRSLRWLGIEWDEGPYNQSEREEIYKEYLLKLIDKNRAYQCFCQKEELEEARRRQREKKEAPKYEGKCFLLSKKEKEKLIKEGKKFVYRLRLPENEIISFKDEVKGVVEFNTKDIGGDFVIAKNNLSTLYNFVCVVDDYVMKISHVIRGEDHISNTPKQILIQRALEIESPIYAHISMTLGADKSKLSKRHGAVSVYEYKNRGYLPEAIINFIALLGWHPGGNEEIYSMDDLIDKFSLSDCQKFGAVFDNKKLDHFNAQYIRKIDKKRFTTLCLPYLIANKFIKPEEEKDSYSRLDSFYVPKRDININFEKIIDIVSLYQERVKTISEITEFVDYFFIEDITYDKKLLFLKDAKEAETIDALKKCIGIISSVKRWEKEEIEKTLIEESGKEKNRGVLLWPMRVALSGKKASASPFDIAWVLDQKTTLKRLKRAINELK